MKLLRLVFLLLFIDYVSAQYMPAGVPLELVDGCPFELKTCQRLQMNGPNAVCPDKLWLSHSDYIYHEATQTAQYTTSWTEIKGLYINSAKKYGYVDLQDVRSLMYIKSKVACSPSIPTHIVHSRLTPSNMEDSEVTKFAPGSLCGRGHTVAKYVGLDKKYCICPYGWGAGPKVQCDDPIDPFGIAWTIPKQIKYPTPPAGAIRETCNILRVEGCPDEVLDGCLKLRFMQRGGDVAYCPYQLWLATDDGWEAADTLTCDWHTKEWMIKRSSRNYKHPMSYNNKWRVQCALSKPTMSHLSFRRVTNVKNEKGESKPSLTHFCFRNWNQTCQNGGHCVHSHRPLEKQQPVLTYCVCPEGFSGEHCEVKKSGTEAIADNPVCSLLLADSCPLNDWDCEPLRLNKATQAIDCPWTLWVSNTQSIHNVFTETNHFTTNWTEIEELRCKNEKWEIAFMDGTARKSEALSLSRKVMCAKNQPFRDADAFWEHRNFELTRTNFASVHPSPIAYCPDESDLSNFDCQYGTCVIAYKNGKFEKACACNFGYWGGNCGWPFDPYGMDLVFAQADSLVRAPLPGATLDTCNVLLAEGCPVQHPSSSKPGLINCTKLRVYGTGVVCARTLWVSHPSTPFEEVFEGGRWTKIDSLECKNERWTFREGEKEEQLPAARIVACATERPWSHSRGFENRVAPLPEKRSKARGNWTAATYCFNNAPQHRCSRDGYCIIYHGHDYKETTYNELTSCVCFHDVLPEDEGLPSFISKYCQAEIHSPGNCENEPRLCKNLYDLPDDGTYRPRMHPRPRPNEAQDNAKKICEPALLEDGCTDDYCAKLKANASHVKCNEQLWLNHGGDFILDWHEVSGVKCIDNQWQTECSKKIGKSKLMCSKDAPSSISSSLYLTIIISAVVIVLLIALMCACCLLRRKQHRVQQAVSLARTPHSSRCPSSTRHSDNARTAREEDSDEK